MILLPWYMYWISLSAAMFMGFVLCAILSVGGGVSIIEDEKQQDDYVDWNHPSVPEWAKWCTIDINGALDYFGNVIPIISEEKKYFEPSEYGVAEWSGGRSDAIIGPLPPWRESLRRRPARV